MKPGHSPMDLANLFRDDEEDTARAPNAQAHATDAGNEVQPALVDPFLLQGDEQTWEMGDWSWDPYTLAAVPKDAATTGPCCQALKRRKLPDLASCHGHAAAPLHQQDSCCNQQTAGACCSFQAPSNFSAVQARAPLLSALQGNNWQQLAFAGPRNEAALWAQPGINHNTVFPSDASAAAAAAAAVAVVNPYAQFSQHAATFPGQMTTMAPASAHSDVRLGAMPSMRPVLGSMGNPLAMGTTAGDNSSVLQCSTNMSAPHQQGFAQQPLQQQASRQQRCSTPGMSKPAGDCSDSDEHGSDSGEDDGPINRRSASGTAKASTALPTNFEGIITLRDVTGDDAGKMICQVAGCGKDLTNLKEYHQRYRICEVHIKLQQVVKDGRLQRFCQQCGRFHDLTAFDGSRKSCREQLLKHNARRRRRAQIEAQKTKTASEAAVAVPNLDDKSEIGRFLAQLMQNPTQLHALRLLLGVQTHPALPPMQPFSPELASPQDPSGRTSSGGAAASGNENSAVAAAPTYGMARDMLQGRGEFAPNFESDHKALRISMKLFNRTPADLPHDLRQQVASWLVSAPASMEGFIRPGCVFLTLQLMVDVATYTAAVSAGVQSLVQHLLMKTGCPFWQQGTYGVQMAGSLAMVCKGSLIALHMPQQAPLEVQQQKRYPQLESVDKLCIVGSSANALTLSGQYLSEPDCEVVVRWQGASVRVPLPAGGPGGSSTIELPQLVQQQQEGRGPARFGCGVAYVEVVRGAWLSGERCVLVVDDADLAAEINSMQRMEGGCYGGDTGQQLLQDLGLVLQHVHAQQQEQQQQHQAGGRSSGVRGPTDHHMIALKARRLLAFACDMGWATVAARVLPLATAQCACAADMVAAIDASSSRQPAGLSLLHRAVRSGSLSLLQGMLHWGAVHKYQWRADRSGPGGITPLHLAALQDDVRFTLALLDHAPSGAFTQLVAKDGTTPFHLAFQMGHYVVDHLTQMLHGSCPSASAAAAGHQQQGGCHAAHGGHSHRQQGHSHQHQHQQGHSHGAAAAGAAGHRYGQQQLQQQEMDPCEVCHSTLPPLLLSIAAMCSDCGARVPCLADASSGHEPKQCAGCAASACAPADRDAAALSGAAAVPSKRSYSVLMMGGEEPAGGSQQRAQPQQMDLNNFADGHLARVAPPVCAHQHGSVYSITAMCQSCHSNRVMEVA